MPRKRLSLVARLPRHAFRASLAIGLLVAVLCLAALQNARLLISSAEQSPAPAASISQREAALPLGRAYGEFDVAWYEQAAPPPSQPEEMDPADTWGGPPSDDAQSDAQLSLSAPAPSAPESPPPSRVAPAAPPPPPPPATSTPVLAQPSTPAAPATGLAPLEQQLFEGQNAERARAGLPALRLDTGLLRIARYRAADMATKGYFSHTSPTGETAFTLIAAANIYAPYAGENIGYNGFADSTSASSILSAFMASPGHRANILNANYTRVGVGLALSSNGTKYYAVVFAGP